MPKRYFFPTFTSLLASPGQPFIHRDISGLQFNERVLAEARASANPLLERVKFLAISAANLDEYFMIRYASLERSIRSAKNPKARAHLLKTRTAILEMAAGFAAKQSETLDLLSSLLEPKGIRVIRQPAAKHADFEIGKSIFASEVLPHLAAPEPFRPSLTGELANNKMAVVYPEGLWFRISRSIPPIFLKKDAPAEGSVSIFFLDDLLLSHLSEAFRLKSRPGIIRLTRDGDLLMDLEEDTTVTPDIVRTGLGTRDRGRPVRLQYEGDLPIDTINGILRSQRLTPAQVFLAPGSLCLHGLWSAIHNIPQEVKEKPGLSYPAFTPYVPGPFKKSNDIFERLKTQDLLLHHPYDAFDGYVNWIRQAAEDPKVVSIQQTVYRTDALSPVIDLLKSAAKNKTVRVVIELRARFDEMNNLRLADDLRRAGVQVSFGFGKLKLHAKVALVTRQEEEGTRTYTHLSTGNYNATTARQYEDLGLLTAQPELGADAQHFFDSVSAGKIPSAFKRLVSAPDRLHKLLLQLIEQETAAAKANRPARVIAKVNALVDEGIVQSLYNASQAGVKVDLIVRGACSLIPGVKNLSENIRVLSLVDRFLEHSRIYYFLDSNRMYLSSADWMPRNFFSRLELAFPVLDPRIHGFIKDTVIPAYLADTVKGRELTAQGNWKRRAYSGSLPGANGQPARAQFYFEELAKKKYAGTPLNQEIPGDQQA